MENPPSVWCPKRLLVLLFSSFVLQGWKGTFETAAEQRAAFSLYSSCFWVLFALCCLLLLPHLFPLTPFPSLLSSSWQEFCPPRGEEAEEEEEEEEEEEKQEKKDAVSSNRTQWEKVALFSQRRKKIKNLLFHSVMLSRLVATCY